MKIKTINRRMFIKTMGGLIITAPFAAKMAPLHAAGLPDTIKFKATVAKNTKRQVTRSWTRPRRATFRSPGMER